MVEAAVVVVAPEAEDEAAVEVVAGVVAVVGQVPADLLVVDPVVVEAVLTVANLVEDILINPSVPEAVVAAVTFEAAV